MEKRHNVIDLLRERGFIDAMTSDELRQITEKPIKVYVGFDPTSDSLHLGNLVGIIALCWFQRCGHTPVAVIGGATGMIGDPSGKSVERNLLDTETLQNNLRGITNNLRAVLDFNHPTAKPVIANNYDWTAHLSFLDFLRDVGKHFRVGVMLAKESVKARINSEEGISYTEFSYQLLQGYDFLHLFKEQGVVLQMGGSDQWGNIVGGIDLVRKVCGKPVYGLTFPLLTRSDGKKFGKSESGAIWLSPEKLSPYEFYQYLVRTADADVINLMRLITFMEMEEIRHYERSMKESGYVPNTAQKRLAEEVTRLVHGEGGLKTALRVTERAAPGFMSADLSVVVLESLAEDMPCAELAIGEIVGNKLIDVMVRAGLLESKGEARRLIKNGGGYLNNEKVESEDFVVTREHLIEGRLLLLGAGKKKKMLIRVAV